MITAMKKGSISNATLGDKNAQEGYAFGSMPSLVSFFRQASLTHELKLPEPATASICSSRTSSKRMFFIVLPVRSNFRLELFSCIGSYHGCNLILDGAYHSLRNQCKSVKPAGACDTNGLLTTNVTTDNEVAMFNRITPLTGRAADSLKSTSQKEISLLAGSMRADLLTSHAEGVSKTLSPSCKASGVVVQQSATTSTSSDDKNPLPVSAGGRYAPSAAPQWVAGCGNLTKTTATLDANSVFFCVVTTAHTDSMVALVGQPHGWPVSVVSGISTPANVTAPTERGNSGGDLISHNGGCLMATTPTQTHTRHPLMASSAKYLAPVQSAENSAHCAKLTASNKSKGYAEVIATVTPKESAPYAKCEPESHLTKVRMNGHINVLGKVSGKSSPLWPEQEVNVRFRSYNRSAAQGGKSHLAQNLTYKTVVGAHAENNSGQKCLPVVGIRGYGNSAPAKSGVGISVPVRLQATQTRPASFLLSQPSHISMVGWVVEPYGSPVSCNAGNANAIQSTAQQISVSGGGCITVTGASTMAKPLYVWRFFSCQRSIYDTVTACTEFEARSQLPDSPCLFAARLPVGGVEMTTPSTIEEISIPPASVSAFEMEVRHA